MEKKFVNIKNNFLTARTKIKIQDVESYINDNLSEFPSEANFIILCGHHHREDGAGNVVLDETDRDIVGDFEDMFDRFEKQCQEKCEKGEKCLWKEKKFQMGSVIVLETKPELNWLQKTFSFLTISAKVISKENPSTKKNRKKYTLRKRSRTLIRKKFNDLLQTNQPNILIHGSCHSYKSEIKDLLYSTGLLSALNVSAERGSITSDQVFKLDPEQQNFVKNIAENNPKDVILMGK